MSTTPNDGGPESSVSWRADLEKHARSPDEWRAMFRRDPKILQQVLDLPVFYLELPVRASNCMEKAEIKTIRQLVTKKEKELLKYRNFGRVSMNDVKGAVERYGLSFGLRFIATPRTDAARYIDDHCGMEPDPNGDWVRVEVAAALETELYAASGTSAIHAEFGQAVERWKEEREYLLGRIKKMAEQIYDLKSELSGAVDPRKVSITYTPSVSTGWEDHKS